MSKNIFNPAQHGWSGNIDRVSGATPYVPPAGTVVYAIKAVNGPITFAALAGNLQTGANMVGDRILEGDTADGEFTGFTLSVGNTAWVYLRRVG